ncbi:unnamed protein product [Chilo suppressalis]|uniref:Uncharacterized protein n=1 Tax=Chilo suppressalis TaxID=168631 RepID=A0ABN8AZH7_CHISP|nr:unnamed protein product [Chilo suppressalis]
MTLPALTLKKVFDNFKHVRSVVRHKHVWSKDNVVKSPYEDVNIPEMTIVDYVWRDLEKWPTKTAVHCGVTNRSYSYEQMYKQSRTLATNLIKKFKVRSDDVIGIMSPNIPEYPIVTFGVLAAGGIVTTFNPVYTEYEVQRQIEISDVKIMIAFENCVPVVNKALKLAKKNIPVISIKVEKPLPENTVSLMELIEDPHVDFDILKSVRRKPNDVAIMPYSSGTTGLPKGVELTNRNLVANCEQQTTDVRQYNYTTETHQDVVLAVLPLFHSYGLTIVMLNKMAAGLKLLTLPKFQPDSFLGALKIHRSNILYVAPPMVLFLGSSSQITPEHFASVRLVTSGAAPLPPADVEKMMSKAQGRKFGIVQGYGMTEAAPLVTLSPLDCDDYETVGHAIPNVELRVVDDKMNNLGPGQVGELLIKGPNIMKGYRNNPEANTEVFVDSGWYRSGDIANIDECGLVYITDRLKELIKVKGYQVPPAELENVLKEHPSIHDAAVIGVPDASTGERPKAFVVTVPGSNVKDHEIVEFVEKRVAPYKKITEIEFVDSIPKSVSGKILRRLLQ